MSKNTNPKDFALPLFFKVRSGDDIDVRVYIRAMATVEDPGLFKRKLSLDPLRFEPSQLAESLSSLDELKNLLNLECAAYKADFLCDDTMVAEQIIKKLEGPLRQALKERGLHLVTIERLGARRLEVEEQIKEDLGLEDSIDRLLLDAEKKGLLKHSELQRFKRSLAWEEEDKERDRRLEQLRKDYEEKRLRLSLQSEADREQFAKENRLLRGWLLDRLEIENRLASYRRHEQIREAEKERRISRIKEGKGFPWWGGIVIVLVVVGIALGVWTTVAGHFPPWVDSYTLTTTCNPSEGGSVSPSSGKYYSGKSITLTATPASGYRFDHWSGDVSGTGQTITVTMDSNRGVVANFVSLPNLPPNVPSNPVPANNAKDVSKIMLSWSGGDPNPDDTVTYDVYFGTSSPPPLVSSRQSGATWAPQGVIPMPIGTCYWKVIAVDNHGATTEGPIWQFDTKGPDRGPYIETSTPTGPTTGKTNQTLTFSTTANTNIAGSLEYRFDWGDGSYSNWSPSPSASHSWSSPNIYTVRAQARLVTGALISQWSSGVTVNIVPGTFPLSTSVSPSGSGSVSPSSGSYDAGTTVTLTATPASGYRFSYWSGDASSTSPTITLTMNSGKNVIANFIRQYTLSTSVSPSGGGNISPSTGTYDAATTVTLTATPASDYYEFASWSGDASGISQTITITMDSNKSVVANFKKRYQRIEYTMPGVPILTTYSVTYSKSLQAGDKVDGFVQLTGQYYSVDNTYEWQFQILGPGGESIQQWKGNWANNNYHEFNFIASYTGTYKLRVTHGSVYSKNLTIQIWPPGWGFSGS